MNKADLVKDLKSFMIAELKLKKSADDIQDDAKLFGPEGLGIDSLDGIQLGVAAEERYKVKIPVDTDEGKSALSSVSSLADFILQSRSGE